MSEGNTPPPPGDQPGGPPPGQPSGEQPAAEQPPPQQPAGAPPPAAPAPQGAAAGVGQPADLGTRFLAKLIDWILITIVTVIVVGTIVVGVILGAAGGGMGGLGTGGIAGLVGVVLSTILFVGYFAFLESNRGQTVGKMLLKLKVVGPDGGNPTMEQALKRNGYIGLYILNVIPIIGWLLSWLGILAANIYIAVTINNDTASRQGWHDEFGGGTKVIKVG